MQQYILFILTNIYFFLIFFLLGLYLIINDITKEKNVEHLLKNKLIGLYIYDRNIINIINYYYFNVNRKYE